MISASQSFGRLRGFFWPIHGYELKKFLPLLAMFFLLSFCYNILRSLKDVLVMTAPGSGAEVIPFLKVWVMFPLSVLMTWFFAKLSSSKPRATVLYIILSLFLAFFALFAFVIYPLRESLHLHGLADYLREVLPQSAGSNGLVQMVRYWSFSLFYGISELWSNIVLFLLFWGFVNEISKVGEAKRFYGLISFGANLASIITAQAAISISAWSRHAWVTEGAFSFGDSDWHQTIIVESSLVIIAGLLCMGIFHWMQRNVLTDPRFYCPEKAKADREGKKKRLSMRESFAYLASSPYLRNLATITICYNLVINLVEVVWKHYLYQVYSDPNKLNIIMSEVTMGIGVVAAVVALLMPGVIRNFGFTFTALATPLVLLVTSICFFGFIFFQQALMPFTTQYLGVGVLTLAVFIGSLQNVLSRAAKYTVFDATKELAYVPLSDECKLRGKTVIDGVGQRLGKSGGSVIHQSLLMFFTTVPAVCPYVAGILLVLILTWTGATLSLGRKFNQLTAQLGDLGLDDVNEGAMGHQTVTMEPVVSCKSKVVSQGAV